MQIFETHRLMGCVLVVIYIFFGFLFYGCKKELTDEQKLWALATTGILTERNNERHDILGGMERTEENIEIIKQSLSYWWGIESREDLLEQLKGLEEGGHRKLFEEMGAFIASLTEEQLEQVRENVKYNNQLKTELKIVEDYYEQFRNKSLLGWDYCRYIALCRWGYLIGYLTEKEAWEKIMPKARLLQKAFDSWSDLGENYIVGRTFWSYKQTKESGHLYLAAGRKLLEEDPMSPWRTIPWDLKLD